MQQQGKVRWIGVSNFNVDLLKKCGTVAPVQSLQPPYSIIQRRYETHELPYCQHNGIGVVVYSPMQSGLLTGKFDPQRLAADDWRKKSEQHTEPRLTKNLQLVAKLKPLAAEYGKTVGQFAIAWTLMNPAVTAAIVGARNPLQVAENIGGADWRIKPADMEQVNSLIQEIMD